MKKKLVIITQKSTSNHLFYNRRKMKIACHCVMSLCALIMYTEKVSAKIPTIRMETSSTFADDGWRNKLTSMFETSMAMRAMTHLANINRNTVTIPLVIRLGLCKLASIALGRAQNELAQILEISKNGYTYCYREVEDALQSLRYSDMILINKMYIKNTNDLQPSFLANSTRDFGVHVEKVDFNKPKAVLDYVNRWIEIATYHRVRDVLEDDEVAKNSSILLVSAAHLKCTWEFSFQLQNTKTLKFRAPFKTVEVPMMTKTDTFLYYKDTKNKFQIIRLHLMQNGLTMTFILPERKDMLPILAGRFEQFPQLLKEAKRRMRTTLATITIPRFKIKSNLDWGEVIKSLGIVQIFNDSFSGLEAMLKSHKETKNMYLSLAKQKVFLEIDEFGIARNAMEAQHPVLTPTPPSYLKKYNEFIADHPFMFSVDIVLSHLGHHTELLLGAYYGPDNV